MLSLPVPFILEKVDEGNDATHEGPVRSADRRSLDDVVTKRHPTTVVDRLDLEHLRVTHSFRHLILMGNQDSVVFIV